MNKEEMLAKIESLSVEVRSIADELLDTSKDVNEVRGRLDAKKEELRKAKQELAQLDMPNEKGNKVERGLFNKDTWLEAVKENRGITIGSTGAILQIKQLVKEVADVDPILSKVRFFYGNNASTNIPVLSPIADPSDYAEGATNVTVDTAASVSVTSLTPKAYAAVLPISAEMLTMGSVNLEAELPSIFQDAFKKVMHTGAVVGAGTSGKMKGLFTVAADTASGSNITEMAQSQTVVKIADLATLALTVGAKNEPYQIVMNPSVYSSILADSTSGEKYKIYCEELIRNKSIEGVPVVLDGNAPTASTSGSVLVVAAPLARYAVGIAGEIVITPIKVKGDTNTYFQAEWFFNGAPVCNKDLYALAVA